LHSSRLERESAQGRRVRILQEFPGPRLGRGLVLGFMGIIFPFSRGQGVLIALNTHKTRKEKILPPAAGILHKDKKHL
jgi:hypothetical protein